MGEIILAVTQALITLGLLFFFYKKDQADTAYRKHLEDKIVSLPQEIHTKVLETVEEVNTHVADLASANFSTYLKHIRELEKMVLPKPITKQMVEDVLQRGTPPAENEISQSESMDGVELNEDNFKNIPITPQTQVVFDLPNEFSEIPTSIE